MFFPAAQDAKRVTAELKLLTLGGKGEESVTPQLCGQRKGKGTLLLNVRAE